MAHVSVFLQVALSAGISLVVSLVGTVAMLRVARRRGWTAKPRADRWHSRPAALFGGIPIWVAFLAGVLPFLPIDQPEYIGLLVGGAMMFAAGLLDDVLEIKPASKILAQIVAAAIMVYFGIHVIMVVNPLVSVPLTILWFVGITNAFNLLDNMDGLSSGIACIASAFVVAVSMSNGNYSVAVLAAALLGSAAGFLVFNFHPARIFMGDSGSLFIGFTLASSALVGTWEHASNLFLVMAVPVLVLAVPIFDTTLVTLTRKLQGRPISQGGRDHSSHRLVALGMSVPRAVLMLWLIAGVFGAVALAGVYLGALPSVMLGGLFAIALLFFGIYLATHRIFQRVEGGGAATMASRPAVVLVASLLHKRRVVEVLADTVLIMLALVGAFLLRYEAHFQAISYQLGLFLPLAIVLKLSVFFLGGVYRSVWRYVSVHDLLVIGKTVAVSSGLFVIAVLMGTRFVGVSRTVFVLDFLLTLVFVGGVRILLRVFRESLEMSRKQVDAPRTLIVGAGDAGEILLRELRQNSDLRFNIVGFVDDDSRKHGALIHGVPVLGGRDAFDVVVRERAIDYVLIAMPRASQDVRDAYVAMCRKKGLACAVSRSSGGQSVIAFEGTPEVGNRAL